MCMFFAWVDSHRDCDDSPDEEYFGEDLCFLLSCSPGIFGGGVTKAAIPTLPCVPQFSFSFISIASWNDFKEPDPHSTTIHVQEIKSLIYKSP